MCKPISAIMLKDRILFSHTSHSHSNILEQYNIRDDNITPSFVKIEFYPENGDMFSDPVGWIFEPDQDSFPDWWVAEVDEARMREAVSPYIKDHIHIGIEGLILSDGLHWIKDCKNVVLKGDVNVQEIRISTVGEMWGSSTVGEMRESSTVGEMRESSTVRQMRGSSTVGEMRGSSTVGEMWGSSTVRQMRGSSTVGEMRGSSTVGEMWGSSTVRQMRESSTVGEMRESSTVRQMRESSTVGEMRGSSTAIIPDDYFAQNVNAKKVILCENSTIKDCRTKTIYQSGEWKLVTVVPKEAEDGH